ncbi:MAG: L-serine ammonia-lyase [Marivibrio sp.]|uniref:L-serine ammonia-lyase n=1 Tax=Marivibrio sp. TaxID=2039719 RepID=UPI0032EB1A37
MFLSVFDLFKIGIGPSSSHTVGPMMAGLRFLQSLRAGDGFERTERVVVRLHGSLAFTGKGHASDSASMLGLMGLHPAETDPDEAARRLSAVDESGRLILGGDKEIAFDRARDIEFDYEVALPGHANGMAIRALDAEGAALVEEIYYSVGGGFVSTAAELEAGEQPGSDASNVPYPFATAQQMLEMGEASGKTIARMKWENEISMRSEAEVVERLDRLWAVMSECIDRGLSQDGVLPGGLKVKRRAKGIYEKMLGPSNKRFQHDVMDWLSLYAMAVNEENAAGGRVVTAPTNGAAGIIPATIRYYEQFCSLDDDSRRQGVHDFLLTAAAIGGIIKSNASISGAEVGCQGEVGSASAMAAAGLAAALGATNMQIENAAEIALEHHLGMTCDPVGGLVQVPCIERNAMGSVKAVNACSLAMKGDGTHFVPLDTAIQTMRETGIDMLSKYKETSLGGLAARDELRPTINVVEC